MFDVVSDAPGLSGGAFVRDVEGRDLFVALYKRTFVISPYGTVTDAKSPPLDFVDTFHGEDGATSSIRRPSMLFDFKPGTDVVLLGHAHASASDATYVDVGLRVGPIVKRLRAHGLRTWRPGAFGGLVPGAALPLREPVPLTYELAYGGADFSDPNRPVAEPRNHVGRGVARNTSELVDQPAARLEYADDPIGRGRNRPAAFSPIHRHWQPRASFAGTYDDVWTETRMPLLPSDFDARFHVCVPEDQWSENPLRGGEPVEIVGATPEGAWRFTLPRVAPGFSSVIAGKRSEHRTHLDTVLIDADARTVELTWRAPIAMPRKYELVDRILVFEKEIRA